MSKGNFALTDFAQQKNAIFDLLPNTYPAITLEYSGEGDEGWINIDTIPGDLPDDALEDMILNLGYDLLSQYYGGWEINDGSQGTITFDPAKRTVRIEHAWRIYDIQSVPDISI